MSQHVSGRRRRAAAVVVALLAGVGLVVALPAAAGAHVTIAPDHAEAGSYTVAAFRVPNERDDSSTVRLEVLLPTDAPVASVRTTPIPGWTVRTRNRSLATPIDLHGRQITEVVSTVIWTATGAGVGPGQFQDFPVSMGPLPGRGQMVFKALQTYADGQQVNWTEVSLDASVEPEHPAPALTLTAPAGEAAPEDADPAGMTVPAVAVDALAGLALVVALAALVIARRRDKP